MISTRTTTTTARKRTLCGIYRAALLCSAAESVTVKQQLKYGTRMAHILSLT